MLLIVVVMRGDLPPPGAAVVPNQPRMKEGSSSGTEDRKVAHATCRPEAASEGWRKRRTKMVFYRDALFTSVLIIISVSSFLWDLKLAGVGKRDARRNLAAAAAVEQES